MLLRQLAAKVEAPPDIIFPADWLDSLSSLLRALSCTRFTKVNSLLVAVADDFEGGVMLYWLLYWLPRGGRRDGWVYKKAAEWQTEVGLSRNKVDRVKKNILPRLGFDIKVMRAEGSPICHYRLNAWRFIQRVADVLELPVYCLLRKMRCLNPTDGTAEKQHMDLLESSKTLTPESTQESNRQSVNDSSVDSKIVDFKSTPVLDMLRQAGLSRQHALPYGTLPEDIVEACIASANEPGVRNRVAYLKAALKNQLEQQTTQPSQPKPLFQNFAPPTPVGTEAPPPNPLPVAARYETGQEETVDAVLPKRLPGESFSDMLRRMEAEANIVPEHLAVLVNDKCTAHDVWRMVFGQIRLQMDYNSFNAYFLRAELIDYEPDCFVVSVPNAHVRDMCQHRYIRTVTRLLRDVVGREVSIRYESPEPAQGMGIGRFLSMSEGSKS